MYVYWSSQVINRGFNERASNMENWPAVIMIWPAQFWSWTLLVVKNSYEEDKETPASMFL